MQHTQGETTGPTQIVLGGKIRDGHTGAAAGVLAGVLKKGLYSRVVAIVHHNKVVEGAALVSQNLQGTAQNIHAVIGDDNPNDLHNYAPSSAVSALLALSRGMPRRESMLRSWSSFSMSAIMRATWSPAWFPS